MNKKTRSLVVLFTLVAGSLVTLATSPLSPAKAAPVETSGLYKITPIQSEYTPIGCYGCPTSTTFVPAFTAQATIGASIASATKIDTFDTVTNVWNAATKGWDQVPVSGGCAIITKTLKCWGNNSYGQLGNGTTTSSPSALVTATTDDGSELTGVTDVSTNGLTTCVVASGKLKCVGSGNWPGNYSRRTNVQVDEQFLESNNWKDNKRKTAETNKVEILNGENTPTYTSPTVASNVWVPDVAFSTQWTTINSLTTGEVVSTGVVKVQVGTNQINNGASTPTICVLKSDGLTSCAKITTGGDQETLTSSEHKWDCNSDGVDYEFTTDSFSWPCGTQSFIVKITRTTVTTQKALVWTWIDSEVTGTVDIAMPSDSWGASSVCFAGVTTTCRTFSGGEFGVKTDPIEGGENSQAVYITNSTYGYPGLCLYSNDTISCGSGSSGTTGPKMATKVIPVAVMAKPLNIFYGKASEMSKLYFLLPTGILSADAWIFNCSQCGGSSSGNAVTPVTAFSASTASAFNFVQSVNGSTDSADYIPMKVQSGARSSSLKYRRVSIKISDTGESLAGVSIRWNAPDAVGTLTLGSSSGNEDKTDTSGLANVYLPNGPVTFTLAPPVNTSNMCPPNCGPTSTVCPPTCVSGQTPGSPVTTTTTIPAPTGTLASGASLQAATITVLVADSGTVDVVVPKPPAIFTRKISVTLENGTPVPSATVQLKNNYLTYAYESSGGSTSSWSSRPKDTMGFLGQMNCSYCFVAPPKYVTGTDGTVTFQSFNKGTRSGAFDAQVAYDDTVFNQAVLVNFASLTETVKLPFMASVKVTLPDADPSTPAVETDADPTTPEVDLKPDANGGVEVSTEVKDEGGTPMGGIKQVAETVSPGCESGGLISTTAKLDTVCNEGAVSAETVSKASVVRAMGVRANGACSAIVQATAGSNGQAKLVLCPTTSTKYRIRGKGALAAKVFCVRVNNVACGVSSTSVTSTTPVITPTTTTTTTIPYTPPYMNSVSYTTKTVSKVAVMKKGKVTAFTTINKVAKVSVPKGAKVVLAVSAASKKFCSVVGTSIKALKAGSCTISVKVTPKATAKVKKPKTKTTSIKIKVT